MPKWSKSRSDVGKRQEELTSVFLFGSLGRSGTKCPVSGGKGASDAARCVQETPTISASGEKAWSNRHWVHGMGTKTDPVGKQRCVHKNPAEDMVVFSVVSRSSSERQKKSKSRRSVTSESRSRVLAARFIVSATSFTRSRCLSSTNTSMTNTSIAHRQYKTFHWNLTGHSSNLSTSWRRQSCSSLSARKIPSQVLSLSRISVTEVLHSAARSLINCRANSWSANTSVMLLNQSAVIALTNSACHTLL